MHSVKPALVLDAASKWRWAPQIPALAQMQTRRVSMATRFKMGGRIRDHRRCPRAPGRQP